MPTKKSLHRILQSRTNIRWYIAELQIASKLKGDFLDCITDSVTSQKVHW